MRRLTSTWKAAIAAVLLTSAAASAQMVADRSTNITFSAPVALPGMTLPAGTYLFKLLDSQTTRSVVQIFDKDRTKIFATLIAIPAQRNEPTNESIVTFKEAPADAPPAIRYWYYAGEKSGQEFAYPKAQAVMIANAAHEPVLAVDTESSSIDDMKSAEVTRVNPANAEPAQAQTPEKPAVTTPPEPQAPPPAPAPQPSATPSQPAVPSETPVGTSGRTEPQAARPAQPSTPPAAAAPEKLPQTASELPLVGLIGVLALGGAIAARAFRRAVI